MSTSNKNEPAPVSRYFSVNRTQPFVVTLLMAVVSFKRIAKLMKKRFIFAKVMAAKRGVSSLRKSIAFSEIDVARAREGNRVIIDYNIPVTVEAPKVYSYENDPAIKALMLKRKNQKKRRRNKVTSQNCVIMAAKQIARFNKKLVSGELNAPDALQRKLNAMSKGPQIKQPTAQQVDDKFGAESQQTHTPGTTIYYGSQIALQARHGGYLSHNDQSNIKASAHKIYSCAQFRILNCDDTSNMGVLTYGSAIWLLVGPNDVLGAQFEGEVTANESRKLHPSLISCRRSNIIRAQQYGRWIIMNRDEPMDTLGKPVGHLDKILLEQEWYFLSSCTPYDSGMYKSKTSIDEAMKSGKDIFNPGIECTWKIHLVEQPLDEKAGEKKRAQVLTEASEQIDKSKSLRVEVLQEVSNPLKNKIDPNLHPDSIVRNTLSHKLSLEGNQGHLVRKFAKIAGADFSVAENSVDFLKNIYGKESNIYQYASARNIRKENRYTGKVFSLNGATEELESQSKRDQEEENYWNIASGMLVHSKAWAEQANAMKKYYDSDTAKKLKAVVTITKFIRKYLTSHVQSFPRLMRQVDIGEDERLNVRNLNQKLDSDHDNDFSHQHNVNGTSSGQARATNNGAPPRLMQPVLSASSSTTTPLPLSTSSSTTSITKRPSMSSSLYPSLSSPGRASASSVSSSPGQRRNVPSSHHSHKYNPLSFKGQDSHLLPFPMISPASRHPERGSLSRQSPHHALLGFNRIHSAPIFDKYPANSSVLEGSMNPSIEDRSIERPKTAAEVLAKSKSRDYGLPKDVVYSPIQSNRTLDTRSPLLLKSLSANKDIYKDIQVIKRSREQTTNSLT